MKAVSTQERKQHGEVSSPSPALRYLASQENLIKVSCVILTLTASTLTLLKEVLPQWWVKAWTGIHLLVSQKLLVEPEPRHAFHPCASPSLVQEWKPSYEGKKSMTSDVQSWESVAQMVSHSSWLRGCMLEKRDILSSEILWTLGTVSWWKDRIILLCVRVSDILKLP